jgi:hypothetical protein
MRFSSVSVLSGSTSSAAARFSRRWSGDDVPGISRMLGAHSGPGELHCAVAQAVHDAVAESEGAGGAEVGHGGTPMLRWREYGFGPRAR